MDDASCMNRIRPSRSVPVRVPATGGARVRRRDRARGCGFEVVHAWSDDSVWMRSSRRRAATRGVRARATPFREKRDVGINDEKKNRPTEPVARAFDSVDAIRRLDERPRRDAIERTHDAVRRSRLVDASGGRARETTDGGERTKRSGDSRLASSATVARPRRRTDARPARAPRRRRVSPARDARASGRRRARRDRERPGGWGHTAAERCARDEARADAGPRPRRRATRFFVIIVSVGVGVFSRRSRRRRE